MSVKYLLNTLTGSMLNIQNEHQHRFLDIFDVDYNEVLFHVEKKANSFIINVHKEDTLSDVLKCEYIDSHHYLCEHMEELKDISTWMEESLSNEPLFKKVFDHSPVGLVLVNQEQSIVKANPFIFSFFNLSVRDAANLRFGNLFNCSKVNGSNFQCGTTEQCATCPLRIGFENAIYHGDVINGQIISQEFYIEERHMHKYFQVSIVPVHYFKDTYALASFVDVTKQIMQQKKLELLGLTDELTQLNNRRFLKNIIESYLHEKSFDRLAIVMLDLDNFKATNDRYGHHRGDQVLIEFANIFSSHLSSSIQGGRYGGEEFLMVIPDQRKEQVLKIVHQIQQEFKTKSESLVGNAISISCGIVYITPEYSRDITYLLDAADMMLYEVKNSGKNGIRVMEI